MCMRTLAASSLSGSGKWIGIEGQSNAVNIPANDGRPSGATIYRNATGSTTLGVSPFDWGPGDPHGWRAATATEVATNAVGKQKAMLWMQGVNDIVSPAPYNSHYGADLLELIANMDSRFGDSNTFWVVEQLHPGTATGTTDAKNFIRAGQAAAAAPHHDRIAILGTDDLVLTDGFHYDAASYTTIWNRFLVLCAEHFQDSSWTT